MMILNHYKKVWIVGASSGIGLALAKRLDAPERELFVSARNEIGMREAFQHSLGRIVPLALDVTSPKQIQAVVGQLPPGLDLVIVNAGTCEYMDSETLDMGLVDRVMQTNFFGALQVVNAILPNLRAAVKEGAKPKLVVMSSSVTYQALPRAHAYGASKSALRYFVECLKIDLQKEGIDVQIVSPGFVKTPLTQKNDFPMPGLMQVDAAAQAIVKGLASNHFDIAFPKRFIFGLKGFAQLPERVRYYVLAKLSRHRETPTEIDKRHHTDV